MTRHLNRTKQQWGGVRGDIYEHRRFVVETMSHIHTGGPEALIQLTLALAGAVGLPHIRIIHGVIRPFFITEYPLIKMVASISMKELRTGDIFIRPEIHPGCKQTGLPQRGVKVIIYLLSTTIQKPERIIDGGCGLITHSWFLSWSNMWRKPLPRQLVVRPYISPSTTRFCREQRTAATATRRDLVLVDNDTPTQVADEVKRICAIIGCRSMVLRGVSRKNVQALLLQAKVIVDWCMVGLERLPIEAVMCGAVLITSRCGHSQDTRDFPIPPQNILNTSRELQQALPRTLTNFATEAPAYDGMRRLYSDYINATSMQAEVNAAATLLSQI